MIDAAWLQTLRGKLPIAAGANPAYERAYERAIDAVSLDEVGLHEALRSGWASVSDADLDATAEALEALVALGGTLEGDLDAQKTTVLAVSKWSLLLQTLRLRAGRRTVMDLVRMFQVDCEYISGMMEASYAKRAAAV